jgi:hypothetical protein
MPTGIAHRFKAESGNVWRLGSSSPGMRALSTWFTADFAIAVEIGFACLTALPLGDGCPLLLSNLWHGHCRNPILATSFRKPHGF